VGSGELLTYPEDSAIVYSRGDTSNQMTGLLEVQTTRRPKRSTSKITLEMDPKVKEQLLYRLRCDARRIADRFDLNFASIEAESARVKKRYGSCHSDGKIKIRLGHARSGRPLKYSSLIDTLCHELAHLRHFNHSRAFKMFFSEILEWAREEGVYCPDPQRRRKMKPAREQSGFDFEALARVGRALVRMPLRFGQHIKRQHTTWKAKAEQIDLL
jgi:YgjP-like, metallopeptidase domain